MRRSHLFAFLLAAILTVSAHAATRTWTGAGPDNWFTTPSNWAENIAPIANDDLVFPAVAQQYTAVNTVPLGTDNFRSMHFAGGNYTISGGGGTLAFMIDGGNQDLTGLWRLWGMMDVYAGSLTAAIFGRYSNFVIDGVGTTTLSVQGSYGGVISKQGPGISTVRLETQAVNSITVNGGQLIVIGGIGLTSGPFTVNGGTLEGNGLNTSALRVTGSNSEFKGIADHAGTLEISNGAKYFPTTCTNAVGEVDTAPVLTGSVLDLQFVATCSGNPFAPFINNRDMGPVIGSFVNYPEGTTVTIGGRYFRITYHGGDGNDVQFVAVPGAAFDFDGDRRADVAVFRPSSVTWYTQAASGFAAMQWGIPTDKIVPADYDGDGRTDIAVYRPSDGTWYILQSIDSDFRAVSFGLADDLPAPADYDGDGRADVAVFRPSDGNWWLNRTILGTIGVHFGQNGDLPVAADYDGDGKADLAFFRPSTATWQIRRSGGDNDIVLQWGLSTDIAVPADYDGDGISDIAVYRPSEGVWYRLLSSTQQMSAVSWGNSTDTPVAADYDGDGSADVAIFRTSEGNWWINGTTSGITVQNFGLSDDKPVPGAFIH